MLVSYSATIFFPGGDPAIGATIMVLLDASNVAPLIFTDSAGLFPAPNPMVADGAGVITFFASPGYYLSELAGTTARIPVDPAEPTQVRPDIFVHVQTVPSTTWTVDHFYGSPPSVDLVMSGNQVEAEIDHPSLTQTVISFTTAQTGAAYLRR